MLGIIHMSFIYYDEKSDYFWGEFPEKDVGI